MRSKRAVAIIITIGATFRERCCNQRKWSPLAYYTRFNILMHNSDSLQHSLLSILPCLFCPLRPSPIPSACERKLRLPGPAFKVFPDVASTSSTTTSRGSFTPLQALFSLSGRFFLIVGYLHSTMLQDPISSVIGLKSFIWFFPLLQIIFSTLNFLIYTPLRALSIQSNQNLLITYYAWGTLLDARNKTTHTYTHARTHTHTHLFHVFKKVIWIGNTETIK